MAGKLTLAAIAKLCGGGQGGNKPPMMGSSTPMNGDRNPPMMGSTTPPRGDVHGAPGTMVGSSTEPRGDTNVPPPPMPPPLPPHHERPSTIPLAPVVSTQDYQGTSNAAAVVSAMAEISDGYNKLLGATLSLLGL